MSVPENWPFIVTNDTTITRLDYDINGNVIYQGWAQPGSATSDTVWRIKKLIYNGSNQLTNTGFPGDANGNPSLAFAFIWDNRAALSYS